MAYPKFIAYHKRRFIKAFDKLKQEITYRTVTRTYNAYSDVTETTSDQTVYAVLEEISDDFIESRGGLIPDGDLFAFVLQSTTSLTTGLTVTFSKKNFVVYNSIIYEIVEIKNDSLGEFYKMLILQRVHSN